VERWSDLTRTCYLDKPGSERLKRPTTTPLELVRAYYPAARACPVDRRIGPATPF